VRPIIISVGDIDTEALDDSAVGVRLGMIDDAVLTSIGAGARRDKAKIAAAATSAPNT